MVACVEDKDGRGGEKEERSGRTRYRSRQREKAMVGSGRPLADKQSVSSGSTEAGGWPGRMEE